jgi:hypothetical protein
MVTLDTKQLLNGLPEGLILHFFATFARFEYALKRCRYLKKTGKGQPAEVSYEKLAQDLPANFLQSVLDAERAKCLMGDPPRSLVVTDYGIGFGPQPEAVQDTAELLRYLWRVRNNLFHGGKSLPGSRDRDQQLMVDVLDVIEMIMDEKQEISHVFHDLGYYY